MGRALQPGNHRRAQRRQRRGDGARSRGDGEGHRCGGRAPRAARSSRGAQTADGQASRVSRKDLGRRSRRAPTSSRGPSRRKSACRSRWRAASRPACRSRTSPTTRSCCSEFQFEDARRQFARGARAGGRGRRDHAVELSAAPDHAEGRAGARRRLHRGAQAFGSRAVQRLHPRRGASRRPGCRRACSTS